MKSNLLVAILMRAGLDTVLRHAPRWFARRGGPNDVRQDRGAERNVAQKMKMVRRLMRWLR